MVVIVPEPVTVYSITTNENNEKNIRLSLKCTVLSEVIFPRVPFTDRAVSRMF